MKTELRKVYFCEHCKKNGISASTVSKHERFCKYNPANKHMCFEMCVYLKRSTAFIYSDYRQGIKTVFTCAVTGNQMYSYQLEKKKTYYPFLISLDNMVRMPLTCKIYKEMSFEEQSIRFNVNEDTND